MYKNFLKKLDCINKNDTDTEMVEVYFAKCKTSKNKQYKTISPDFSKYRLTIDYEEDYWLLRSIINILGQNPSRNEIESLFINNPDFYKINFFRNIDKT